MTIVGRYGITPDDDGVHVRIVAENYAVRLGGRAEGMLLGVCEFGSNSRRFTWRL
jgi:hypothetical protein